MKRLTIEHEKAGSTEKDYTLWEFYMAVSYVYSRIICSLKTRSVYEDTAFKLITKKSNYSEEITNEIEAKLLERMRKDYNVNGKPYSWRPLYYCITDTTTSDKENLDSME